VGAADPATCTDASDGWVFNSLGQSPCYVAGELAGICSPEGVTLPKLVSDNAVYYGPVKGQNDTCQCTTVFYSLVSACAVCQDRKWISLSQFMENCTTILPDFPDVIPSYIQIPAYAFLNVKGTNTFDPIAAAEANSTQSHPTVNAPSSTPTSSHNRRVSAIVGGVIPAVLGLAVAVGIILCFYRRRRKNTGLLSLKRSSKQYVQLSDSGPALIATPQPTLFQHRRRDSHVSDVFNGERSV